MASFVIFLVARTTRIACADMQSDTHTHQTTTVSPSANARRKLNIFARGFEATNVGVHKMSTRVCEREVSSNGVSPPLYEWSTKKTDTCEEGALQVKRLSANATLPTRGSRHAAGYDLYRCVVCSNFNFFFNKKKKLNASRHYPLFTPHLAQCKGRLHTGRREGTYTNRYFSSYPCRLLW